jgi:hypothetical protein
MRFVKEKVKELNNVPQIPNLIWKIDDLRKIRRCFYTEENTTVVDWQVTATPIYCGALDDDMTIIVCKDWSARSTGC